MAIIPRQDQLVQVYEVDKLITVENSARQIIAENLQFNGQTLRSTLNDAQQIIGKVKLPPIMFHNMQGVYWIYTLPIHKGPSAWIALHGIKSYVKAGDGGVVVTLTNDQWIYLDVPYQVFKHMVGLAKVLKERQEKRIKFMFYYSDNLKRDLRDNE